MSEKCQNKAWFGARNGEVCFAMNGRGEPARSGPKSAPIPESSISFTQAPRRHSQAPKAASGCRGAGDNFQVLFGRTRLLQKHEPRQLWYLGRSEQIYSRLDVENHWPRPRLRQKAKKWDS